MIALVFPFQGELESFLGGAAPPGKKLRGVRVVSPPSDPDWLLAVCGQGKVEAALACQILADTSSPEAYFLLGSAAGLDPSLKVGDAVLADPCLEWDFRSGYGEENGHPSFRPGKPFMLSPLAETPGIRTGPVLSADRDVFDPEVKSRMHGESGALAMAWEGAGFHRFLRRNNLPGWEIRVVTETAQEGRISLAELRRRMLDSFPALRKAMRAALRPAPILKV